MCGLHVKFAEMNKTNPKTPLLVFAAMAFTVLSFAGTNPFSANPEINSDPEKAVMAISCPTDVTVNVDPGLCTAAVSYAPPAPGFGTIVVQTTGLPTGSAFPVGVTTNSFEERTVPGGTVVSTCSFTVTVVENENPTITCAADVNGTTDYSLCEGAVIVPAPTVNDNCGIASVINDYNGTSDASDSYPVGTTTITWTVTDNAGNTATCTQNITIVDDEDPTIDCALSVVVPTDPGQCSAVVTYAIPVGTDNCAGAVTTQTDSTGLTSGDAFPVGVTTLEYTVTDAVGRSNSCTFTITVEDREAPVIPVLPDLTAQCTVDAPIPTTIDNCDGIVYGITGDPTYYSKEGTYVINWKFEDSSGNEIIDVQQNVIIDDTIAPIPDSPALPDIYVVDLSLIHISEPTRRRDSSRMPSSA